MAKKTISTKELGHKREETLPLYANVCGVFESEDTILIDFGFVGLSYYGKHDPEDSHVARISLSWEIAENLSKLLKDRISEHKKAEKPKRTTKSKG